MNFEAMTDAVLLELAENSLPHMLEAERRGLGRVQKYCVSREYGGIEVLPNGLERIRERVTWTPVPMSWESRHRSNYERYKFVPNA